MDSLQALTQALRQDGSGHEPPGRDVAFDVRLPHDADLVALLVFDGRDVVATEAVDVMGGRARFVLAAAPTPGARVALGLDGRVVDGIELLPVATTVVGVGAPAATLVAGVAPAAEPPSAAVAAPRQPARSRFARAALVLGLAGLGVGGAVALAQGSPAPQQQPLTTFAKPAAPAARHRLDVYRGAGLRYGLDWRVLASIGAIESDHGRSALPGVRGGANPAGAQGPMQFLPATWTSYGYDADGDGRSDVYDLDDAVNSAASFLRARGAPRNWHAALLAYNPDIAYGERVLAMAARRR